MFECEKGIVLDVQGKVATVGIKNTDWCSNCNLCSIRKDDLFIAKAQNLVKARKGDLVLLKRSSKTSLVASSLVFGLPVLILISTVAVIQNIFHQSQGFSVLIGFITFLLAFIPSKLYNNHLCRSQHKDISIIKVLSPQNLPE